MVITFDISEKLRKILFNYNKYFNLTVIRIGKKEEIKKLKNIKELYIDEERSWHEIESMELAQ